MAPGLRLQLAFLTAGATPFDDDAKKQALRALTDAYSQALHYFGPAGRMTNYVLGCAGELLQHFKLSKEHEAEFLKGWQLGADQRAIFVGARHKTPT
jgi:hypothetical protein